MYQKTIFVVSIVLVLLFSSCGFFGEKKQSEAKCVNELLEESRKLYDAGRYQKALNHFNEIAEVDSMIGEVYFSRAYCYSVFRDYENSNSDYLRAIELNHRLEDSFFNLGCNFFAMMEDSIALKHFERCLEINPKNSEAKEFIEILIGKKELKF